MEDQSNGRIKEFKTGLGDTEDVVKRHAEKAISLRKDKRDDKIQRMRRRQTQEEQQKSKIPDKFEEQALAAREVFLRTGSMESLVFIQRYLRCMDDEDINNLLDDQGLLASSLVPLLTHPNIQYVVIASDCLVNITGSVNAQKISSVAAIMTKTNFISIAHTHITTTTNSNNVSPIRLDMWMCIANMACLCQDARNILLQTSIFRNFNTNQNATPPPPPFMLELSLGDPATLPILLLILEGFCAEKEAVPNEPFIMAHWRLICNILYTICPPPMKDTQMDDDHLKHLSMILLIINSTLKKVSSEFCIRLLAIERPLISFLVGLAQRTEKELVNQIRILQTLVHIGLQNVPQYEFQNIMREAGCVQLMSVLSHSGNERVRREAMMWIGNYASECFQFVKHLLECRAFDGVTAYLKHPSQPALVSQAIYVLAAASQSCYRNSDLNSVFQSNETLKVLLGQNKWLCHTAHRLGRLGCDEATLDILSLWINLIKWDKHFIVPLLEETGGLSKVDELLASKNTAIWSAANRLDELLQHYNNNNNNEEMDTMN
jgi:hypothetical protein